MGAEGNVEGTEGNEEGAEGNEEGAEANVEGTEAHVGCTGGGYIRIKCYVKFSQSLQDTLIL